MILCVSFDDMPIFGEISRIEACDRTVKFYFRKMKTKYCNETLNAFCVTYTDIFENYMFADL